MAHPGDQAFWRIVVSGPPPSGLARRELTTAYGRRVTFRLDGTCDAQISMNGGSDEADEILELQTDLIWYRTTVEGVVEKLFRGRIITETDDVSASNHVCQFSAIDYRGMLGTRVVGAAGKSFVATDVGLIAWTLISDSQALTNGNWGVTNGAGATAGVVHTISYDPGSDISDMMTNLAHRAIGPFEWEIDGNLAFNRYYPKRGTATGAILDYGGVVASVRKTLTSNDFGNVALLTGDGSTTVPVVKTSATVATDPQGRWERYAGFPDIKEQPTLDERASWVLGQIQAVSPTWVVTLLPGRWDKATMWLGDTVRLVARSGRLNVNALVRIIEINISIDEENVETVQMGLLVP